MEKDFTAQKLNLLDRALVDPRLTDQDYRVLAYIAQAVDRETGLARRKQAVIQEALSKKSVRGIQISLGRLADCGYIKFETKDGGTYVNAYRLLLEKANDGSSSDDRKAKEDSPFWKKRRTETPKKANGSAEKSEPSFVQDPFISLDVSSRAREPATAKALGSLPALLASRLGADVARSWFGKAEITDVAGDTLTIGFPTKFLADYVRANFEPQLLNCCSELAPTINFVRVVAVRERGAGVAA